MALLKLNPKRPSASVMAFGLAIVALAGCAIFNGKHSVRRSYAFSHKVHTEQELACTDCHLAAETANEPGMPAAAACKLCHAEIDAAKPPERKIETLFDGKAFRAVRHSEVGPEIVFPHLKHVQAGLECASCHAALPGNEDALELPVARMDMCTKCHDEKKVANDCATCHPTILPTEKPSTHDALWTRRHGGVCKAGGGENTADRCELCHKETACAACHLTTPPQNHTQQWRRVGHGISAELDRESCSTCHQPSTCQSCHSESQPRSHTANFGAPRANHCLTCHEPLQGESCAACHQGTPSHMLASPKPASHNAAMDCRQCHMLGGVLPPMPHVDNGANCNSCHH